MTELVDFEKESEKDLAVNDRFKSALDIMVYWSLLIGILGLIGSGFMIIASLAVLVVPAGPFASGFIALFYFILGLVSAYPSFKLVQFSRKSRMALKTNRHEDHTDGIEQLKYYFQFVGISQLIFFVIVPVLYFLAMILFGIFAVAMS
ncbi:MAG: hypothetical protein O2818_08585 [Bacteroidetes bacterium]|nr:hypothetical protein [Bacteroidota bacterium]